MTIWRTCTACWLPKAINKPCECIILIAFPLQQLLHESASMLCYTQIAALVLMPLLFSCITIHLAYNETKNDNLYWSHLALKLLSKIVFE
jgi:hypothetical protein